MHSDVNVPASGTLHDNLSPTYPLFDAWGDAIIERKNTFRVVHLNVNGLPQNPKRAKYDDVETLMRKYKPDCISLNEHNLNYSMVYRSSTLGTIFHDRFRQCRTIASHNRHEKLASHQAGGTALIALGPASNRVQSTNTDPSGLGRWCCQRLHGRDGRICNVILFYLPNHKGKGLRTVHAQQARYLQSQGISDRPRAKALNDIAEFIRSLHAADESVILCTDANEDCNSERFDTWIKDLGLRLPIKDAFGPCPITYQRGSKCIDTIAMSVGLPAVACGALAFDDCVNTNHRYLWVDISSATVFGSKEPTPRGRGARCLQCSDPRTVERYNKARSAHAAQHRLGDRAAALDSRWRDGTIDQQDCASWEILDRLRCEGIIHASKRCRRLCMGSTPWSPTIQTVRDKVMYAKMLLRRRKGLRVGSRQFKKLAASTGADPTQIPPFDTCVAMVKSATRELRDLKPKADALRTDWLENLVKARGYKYGIKKETEIQNLLRREEQRNI